MTAARRAAEDTISLFEPRHEPQRAVLVEAPVLRPVSGRPPLPVYLDMVWARRHFIAERAWSLAVTQNKGFLLGNLWLILNPLVDAAIYMVLFGVLFSASTPDFPAYLLVGIFMFGVTSRDVNSAAGIIQTNKGLIRAFSFPRAVLTLASVLRNLLESVPSLVVMWLMLVPMVGAPRPTWLLFPVLFVVHVVFDTGLAFSAARLGSDVPDARRVIPILFRFLLYGSAITFAVSRYDALPWLARIVHHNPLFLLVDGYRQLLLNGTVPTLDHWAELLAWAMGALLVGLWWFWRAEVSYGRND